MYTRRLSVLSCAAVIALALSGCGGGGGSLSLLDKWQGFQSGNPTLRMTSAQVGQAYDSRRRSAPHELDWPRESAGGGEESIFLEVEPHELEDWPRWPPVAPSRSFQYWNTTAYLTLKRRSASSRLPRARAGRGVRALRAAARSAYRVPLRCLQPEGSGRLRDAERGPGGDQQWTDDRPRQSAERPATRDASQVLEHGEAAPGGGGPDVGGVDREVGAGRRLVGVVDACEFPQETGARLGVEPLGVARLAGLGPRRDVDLHESPQRLDGSAKRAPVRGVGRNDPEPLTTREVPRCPPLKAVVAGYRSCRLSGRPLIFKPGSRPADWRLGHTE